MKRWRVMVNDLKLGTGVLEDNLSAEQAEELLATKQKKYKNGRDKLGRAHFTQEYEENRVNK
jgi:hypothetical protein